MGSLSVTPRELLHFHTAIMFNSELQQNLYLLSKWTEVEYRIGTILVLLWVTLMSALARDVVQDMQYRMQSAVCCMPCAIEYAAPCA